MKTFPNRGREPRVRVAIGARAAARRVLPPHGPLFVSGQTGWALQKVPQEGEAGLTTLGRFIHTGKQYRGGFFAELINSRAHLVVRSA